MPLSESDVPWHRLMPIALVMEESVSMIYASLELPCNNSEITSAAVQQQI